jgi:hypothetical protein
MHVSSKVEDALLVPSVDAAASGERKLSPLTLTAMVVGSMMGAGIFSLPATFGRATDPFGALIAWVIAGGGMLMLAFVFQILAQRKPDLDAGIFACAKAGFGNYLGFAAASPLHARHDLLDLWRRDAQRSLLAGPTRGDAADGGDLQVPSKLQGRRVSHVVG